MNEIRSPRPDIDLGRLLAPETRRSSDMEAVWSWLVDQDSTVPDWTRLPAAEARALQDRLTLRWNRVLPEVESFDEVTVPGDVPVRCQWIVPPKAEPGCILYLHGGGWAFGNLATHQRLMRLIALASGRRILAVDYRLAPEHPFPAPLDDCRTAWRWLCREARSRPELSGPLSMAGDSAGANLVVGVMLDAAEQNGVMPASALLFYGAYQAGTETPSYARFAEGFGLTRAGMARFWDFYAPPGVDRSDPRLSPVLAQVARLARLPPLYLNAAGLDPLLCDTLEFVAKLKAAGTPHEFRLHEGVHHGFMQMSLRLPEAEAAIAAATSFLRNLPEASAAGAETTAKR